MMRRSDKSCCMRHLHHTKGALVMVTCGRLGLGDVLEGVQRCVADEGEEADEDEEEEDEHERLERLERESRQKKQELRFRREKRREAKRQAQLEQSLASKVGWHASDACIVLMAVHPVLEMCENVFGGAINRSAVRAS